MNYQVPYEVSSISSPNHDRKTAFAFWFLSAFATELIAIAALVVLR
jgi:hypothetical protein